MILEGFFLSRETRIIGNHHAILTIFHYNNLKFLYKKYSMELYGFDLKTIDRISSIFLKLKTFLDTIGIHTGGLYTYAINK